MLIQEYAQPPMHDSHEEFDVYYKNLIDQVNYKRRASRSGKPLKENQL